MIKFIMERDQRKLIGLGLSAGNIRKLQKGKPIQIMGEEMEIPNMDILIFYGNTEEEMAELLKKHGLITDATKVNISIGDKH